MVPSIPLLALTHLLVFSLPFLLLLHASPAPDPYPAVVSLPGRQPPSSSLRIAQPQTTSEVEHDLMPFVIVSTIDGALHAIDRDKGDLKWTLRDGVDPLVGGGIKGKVGAEEYIVEPLSGSLYVFEEDPQDEGGPRVRKLPLSVEQLIEMSPFTFPHSPSRTFTGSKHTSLLTVDLKTGRQITCYSTLHNSSVSDDCTCDDGELLDDLEHKGRSNRDVLFIGRTDYRLTIHSPPSFDSTTGTLEGTAGRRSSGVQEITYSTYTPNNFDKPLAEYWAKAGPAQIMWEADGTPVKRMRVELGHDGLVAGVQQGGRLKWSRNLGSVGIAVYDILLPLVPANANPILVPQPRALLESLYPAEGHHSHYDLQSKPPMTYIGSMSPALTLPPGRQSSEENDGAMSKDRRLSSGSRRNTKPLMFALSSESYPLINFAPPPQPGSFTNGSFLVSESVPESDQLLPYLLDPPAEDMALAPVGETGVIEVEAPSQHPAERTPLWWLLGFLASLVMCAIALTGVHRRRKVKQASSPTDERTPLLLEQPTEEKGESVEKVEPDVKVERTVKIVEPEMSPSRKALVLPGEEEVTPKKKSTRRRVRGKKKRRDSSATLTEKDGDGDEDEEDEKGESSSSPPHSVSQRDDKPLPELPREISTTALADEDDKERLTISDTIIGFGSHGTVVLKGTWGGRAVAVKRLLSDFTRLASQEVKLLQASDDHPNVIRYYCQDKRENFLYIALDLCQASLADLIETPDKHMELAASLDRKKALMQVSAGLKHLHGMKIIHRDIKPQNVLVSQGKDRSLRMLVSDFGLARRLEQDQSSFAPTANNLAGSLGWRAPECIRGQVRLNDVFDRASSYSSSSGGSSSSLQDLSVEAEEKDMEKDAKGKGYARLTKAVDLFALGCLYFWVLMSGEHPFGAGYDRESNIVKGEAVNMAQLDVLGEEGYEAKELIGKMLSMDPTSRPDTSECMSHPFFWTPSKRLAFLCDASDRFEIMETDPPEAALESLERDAVEVVGKDWYSRLDKTATSNLGKYRKYKGNSVRDLLRAMRNKKHHYQDLEPSAKKHFGALPAGFLHFWTSRYPTLFLHVHAVIRNSRLRHESMFEQYFQEGSA